MKHKSKKKMSNEAGNPCLRQLAVSGRFSVVSVPQDGHAENLNKLSAMRNYMLDENYKGHASIKCHKKNFFRQTF